MIKQFKERSVDRTKPVKVYRNLNNGMLSISQKGVVVGHTDAITLKNCTFIVGKGRERVLKEKVKNVHAFVYGYIVEPTEKVTKPNLMYNPYTVEFFTDTNTKEAVLEAVKININSKGQMEYFK